MSASESEIPDSDKVIKAITPGAKSAQTPLNPNSRTQKKIVLNRTTGKLSQRIAIERNEPQVSQHSPASGHTAQKQPPSFGKIIGLAIASVLLLGGAIFALTRFLSNPPPHAHPAVVNTPTAPPVSLPQKTTPPPINTSPLAEGLIAHWKLDGDFNETTGTEMTGVTLSPPTFVDGKEGKAIRLNGTDPIKIDEVSPAVKELDQTFTISTWIRAQPGASQSLAASFVSRGVDMYSFCLGQNYTDRFRITVKNPNEEKRTIVVTKKGTYPAGEWHHLCLVRNNKSIRIYVNGQEATKPNEINLNLDTSCDAPLMIGGNPSSNLKSKDNRAFIGEIDEVRIYNRALPPEHVIRLFKR